jgi:hypothetical protein
MDLLSLGIYLDKASIIIVVEYFGIVFIDPVFVITFAFADKCWRITGLTSSKC